MLTIHSPNYVFTVLLSISMKTIIISEHHPSAINMFSLLSIVRVMEFSASKSKFIIIGPGGMHGVQCTENIYQKRLAREHKCWNRAECESVTDNSEGNSSQLLIRLLECVSSTWDKSVSLGIFSFLHSGQADKAWGGNVNTLTRFLRPLTHFGPWSKARSHSRGQPTALNNNRHVHPAHVFG